MTERVRIPILKTIPITGSHGHIRRIKGSDEKSISECERMDSVEESRGQVGRMSTFEAGLIAFGAALNVAVGYLVSVLKLPLYLDSIGTILISALCGWRYGMIVGFAALAVLSVTSTPTVITYAGTVIVVAVSVALLERIGFLHTVKTTIIGGLMLGLVATAASVPVTTFLYGGVSLAGADAVTTFFKSTGMPVWKSVLFGSLVTDPIDKLFTSLICLGLIRALPQFILRRITDKPGFLSEHSLHRKQL